MKISFTKKEILNLLISALVLGFVFGFDDGREVFIPRLWLANYVLMSFLGLILLSIMVLGHKWAAARYNIAAEYSIWKIRRFGFREYQYIHKNPILNKIPLGILLPVVIAIFTEGKIWFAATGMMLTTAVPEHRIGRKWTHIPDYEEARIAFAGPLVTLIVMGIAGLMFENSGWEIWKQVMMMNVALVVSNMIPFPHLPGGRMLLTSLYLFVFALTLAGVMSLLILFIPAISTMIMALLLAVLTVGLVYFQRET